jgi:hypothetical protein
LEAIEVQVDWRLRPGDDVAVERCDPGADQVPAAMSALGLLSGWLGRPDVPR